MINLNLDRLSYEVINEMKSIHFIADLHASHVKIISICNRPIIVEYDGIKDLSNNDYKYYLNEAHNEWLVNDVINKWVSKKDTLYILGDVSMDNKIETEKFIDRLNGIKFLIVGNHDKNILHSTRFSQISQIKDFTYSKNSLNLHIVLCHYPMLCWNRKIHGSWHLFGHEHGRVKTDSLSMDVGVDSKELLEFTNGVYRPLNLYEICQIMINKQNLINKN